MSLLRNVTVVVRAGHGLKNVELMGANDPYVVLELQGQRVQTDVDRSGGENPVWAQTFKFVLPMEKPGEAAPALRAAVMNSRHLLPDQEIGSGSAAVTSLLRGQGSEEVTIPLTDKKGNTTGALQLGVIVEMGEGAQLGSAAGTTVGTVHMPVGGLPETALPPASQEALLQSRQPLEPGLVDTGVSITTAPEVGPTAGVGSGQVVNPASATFGVMQ